MLQLRLRTLVFGLPAVAALSLVTACGGDSGGDGGGGAGQSGGGSSSAGTSSSSGSGNKAGASSSGGSNNGAGDGDFSTDVSGSKPLGELTPAEVEELCDDLDAYYTSGSISGDLDEFSCRLAGVLGAVLSGAETDEAARTACQTAYDACQAEPSETTSQECGPPSGECTATVAELTACTNDSAEALRDATEQFPACSELTLDDLSAAPGEEGMQPASCATFEMKCPGGPTPPTPTM
jgi:hypothetical protein